ncbi:hypothetical protein RR46_03972 [Papilio xuthus]|uniref:Uncharacterized protein n=1 Tax=Papilio xuthus TaxID=66420 RepID=A0A194QJP4_PAPXU|nr:hypothetical protein RR46_03972 [Papilio xuthus]
MCFRNANCKSLNFFPAIIRPQATICFPPPPPLPDLPIMGQEVARPLWEPLDYR